MSSLHYAAVKSFHWEGAACLVASQGRCATRQGCLKQGEVASAAGELSEPANSATDDSAPSLLDTNIVSQTLVSSEVSHRCCLHVSVLSQRLLAKAHRELRLVCWYRSDLEVRLPQLLSTEARTATFHATPAHLIVVQGFGRGGYASMRGTYRRSKEANDSLIVKISDSLRQSGQAAPPVSTRSPIVIATTSSITTEKGSSCQNHSNYQTESAASSGNRCQSFAAYRGFVEPRSSLMALEAKIAVS